MNTNRLNQIEEQIKSIVTANKNKQNCPFCGAGLEVKGGIGGELIYEHSCECFLELNLEAIALTENAPKSENPPIIVGSNNICLPSTSTVHFVYYSHCHSCGQDGIDSTHPDCIYVPPYGYTCRFCGASLRSHHRLGEGKSGDLANRFKT